MEFKEHNNGPQKDELITKPHKKSILTRQQLQEQVEGYCFPILSPFGKVLSLCGDLYSSPRSITEVENNIAQCARPFIGYATQRGSFSSEVRALSKAFVLEQLEIQKHTYECIFTNGEDEMEPFMKVAQLFVRQIKNEKAGVKINVYIPNNSHYSQIVPWMSYPEKVRIITLETDAGGSVKSGSLISAVLKYSQKSKIQIVQLSGLSTINRQKIDLRALYSQIDALRLECPQCEFYGLVEGSSLLQSYPSSERKDILNTFDISIFQGKNIFGGLKAASFILFRKDIYHTLTTKGDHSLVKGQWKIPTSDELRCAQLLQLYHRERIEKRIEEAQDGSKLFYTEVMVANQRLREISVLNKIDLLAINDYTPNGRYSLRILTESSGDFLEEEARGYPVLLVRQAQQLLHDLFGIIVPANPFIQAPLFKFSSAPNHIIEDFKFTKDQGYHELNSSVLDLDIHFLLSPQDIVYIVAALEQLAMYGSKLLKFYSKKTLKPKSYYSMIPDFSIETCSTFHYHPLLQEEERGNQYVKQLTESMKILKSPQQYFSMNEHWTEDRTIVFPLEALFSAFPMKNRIIRNVRAEGHDDSSSDDDSPLSSISDRQIRSKIRILLIIIYQLYFQKKIEILIHSSLKKLKA